MHFLNVWLEIVTAQFSLANLSMLNKYMELETADFVVVVVLHSRECVEMLTTRGALIWV